MPERIERLQSDLRIGIWNALRACGVAQELCYPIIEAAVKELLPKLSTFPTTPSEGDGAGEDVACQGDTCVYPKRCARQGKCFLATVSPHPPVDVEGLAKAATEKRFETRLATADQRNGYEVGWFEGYKAALRQPALPEKEEVERIAEAWWPLLWDRGTTGARTWEETVKVMSKVAEHVREDVRNLLALAANPEKRDG